jgi:hypothetical protein
LTHSKEIEMPPQDMTKYPKQVTRPRLSTAERRAAEVVAGAGIQAQLKLEAAERRAERARRETTATGKARRSGE